MCFIECLFKCLYNVIPAYVKPLEWPLTLNHHPQTFPCPGVEPGEGAPPAGLPAVLQVPGESVAQAPGPSALPAGPGHRTLLPGQGGPAGQVRRGAAVPTAARGGDGERGAEGGGVRSVGAGRS